MPTKPRKIYYTRPQWNNGHKMTLQTALHLCLNQMPNVNDTRLTMDIREAEIRHRSVEQSAIYLHIAFWTPNEAASTVPHNTAPRVQDDLAYQPAGKNWDYLKADGMVLITKNHFFIIPSGIRVSSIERYIRKLLNLARNRGVNLPTKIEHFKLIEIVNHQVAEKLRKEGAKKVDINVGQYFETARDSMEDRRENIFRHLGRETLYSLVKKEEDRRKIEEADNVNARLVITLDTRRAGLEPSDLAPMVENLHAESDDDDDFVIETKSGERIKKGRLVLSKKVNIESFNNTVRHDHAWVLMNEYYDELNMRRALEE